MPREVDATGPQNEAEQQLYQLLRAGMDGAVSETTSIAELTAELRSRIQNRR